MTEGEMIGDVNDEELAPPDDTGETVGLLPSSLTVTFGFGPSLFETRGLGLAAQAAGGAEAAAAAARRRAERARKRRRHLRAGLRRRPPGRLPRGPQPGPDRPRHGRRCAGPSSASAAPPTTSRSQDTPRNLMGMKDGTANIRAEDTEAMDRFVWLGTTTGRPGCNGGSYMVTRRIRMLLEVWDRSSLEDQEQTIGRHKYSGAPLGGSDEFDPLDLDAEKDGQPVIPANAHVRLASAQVNDGERILRRGYSFTDGVDESLGELEAGLFFICLPARPGEAVRRRSSAGSARWTRSTSTSSTSAAPSSPSPRARASGGYVGEAPARPSAAPIPTLDRRFFVGSPK